MSEVLFSAKDLVSYGRNGEGSLKGVSFDIHGGERVAFFGGSDSGASLALRVLGGLKPYWSGELKLQSFSYPIFDPTSFWDDPLPRKLRRKMGVLCEKDGLLSNVSIREGLETLFRFKYGDHNEGLREGVRRVVREVSQIMGIGESSMELRPSDLSAVERRLASLARMFMSKPGIILMENPSLGLSLQTRPRLFSAFEAMLGDSQRTLLMQTEDWSLAHRFCERWIVFEQGKIVFDGSPKDFLKTENSRIQELKDLEKWIQKENTFLDLLKDQGAA